MSSISWLTNSALVYEPNYGGEGGSCGFSDPLVYKAVCTQEPKYCKSNPLFNLPMSKTVFFNISVQCIHFQCMARWQKVSQGRLVFRQSILIHSQCKIFRKVVECFSKGLINLLRPAKHFAMEYIVLVKYLYIHNVTRKENCFRK